MLESRLCATVPVGSGEVGFRSYRLLNLSLNDSACDLLTRHRAFFPPSLARILSRVSLASFLTACSIPNYDTHEEGPATLER